MSTTVRLTTINIQSLKSKELTPIEHLGSNDADMCVVTETWLMMMTKFGSKVANSTKMAGSVTTSTDRADEVEA